MKNIDFSVIFAIFGNFRPWILVNFSVSMGVKIKRTSELKSTVEITPIGFFVAFKNLLKIEFYGTFVYFTVAPVMKKRP